MGIISIEQSDRLYWLGRYVERVYTTTSLFANRYDIMIDGDLTSYKDFCESLDIPNIYPSAEDFQHKYSFDKGNENSIFSNLMRGYDNAIELRETIGSEALSYIQLAIYSMNKAEASNAPLIEMQHVMDNIHAFWGAIDDGIGDEKSRNTVMIGKRIERIDLYGRLHLGGEDMLREYQRMAARIGRSSLKYNENVLENLYILVNSYNLDYNRIVQEVEENLVLEDF